MRTTYIVSYDIADPKRLRKVFKTMRNWGDHLQLSVFECQLTDTELLQCRTELAGLINHAHDQILFIALGPSENRGERVIEALGIPYQSFDAPCLIV